MPPFQQEIARFSDVSYRLASHAMRLHHLNCATMCPPGGRLVDGVGGLTRRAKLVCHCVLVETDDGLVLVDSGLGTHDVEEPKRRLGIEFIALTAPRLARSETALAQIEALGFSAADVRHVVLTHLDVDHAGGLPDFPEATVHVMAEEHRAAMHPATFMEGKRYHAMQWAHDPRWSLYRPQSGERWFGFECVRKLSGLPPEILMIPLAGHTRGHAGVAVQSGDGWLLHAGDAYFYRGEMDSDQRRCTPLLDVFQRIMQVDGEQRLDNQERLRQLARENAGEVRVFCAHDAVEFSQFQGGAARAVGA